MPLAAVSDILFCCDEFWGHSTLNSLRMLLSTCRGFRDELQQQGGANPVEHAMLVVIQRRPMANNDNQWMMGISDVRRRFGVDINDLVKFLTACLVDNQESCLSKQYGKIHFIDAYRLASKAGLRAAMERRDRRERKALEPGFD